MERDEDEGGTTAERVEPVERLERVERSSAELGRRLYPMLNCLVAPRPIAWVSTVDTLDQTPGAATTNVAPHSYFTVSSVDPPVVQFTSVGRKDSLRNIEATGEFVVNVVPWGLRYAVNQTSIDAPPDVDEIALAGLTAEPSRCVRPPRIAESPAAIECRLVEVRSFGEGPVSGHVVFGEVLHVAVRADVMADDGLPDLHLLDSATRADRSNWVRLGEFESIERPSWDT